MLIEQSESVVVLQGRGQRFPRVRHRLLAVLANPKRHEPGEPASILKKELRQNPEMDLHLIANLQAPIQAARAADGTDGLMIPCMLLFTCVSSK